LTWQDKYAQAVEQDLAWFLFHGQHPGETKPQREARLAKYCQSKAKGEPGNYWRRKAAEHQANADAMVKA